MSEGIMGEEIMSELRQRVAAMFPAGCEACGQPVTSIHRDTRVTGQAPDKRGHLWDVLELGDLHGYCREHAPEPEPYPDVIDDDDLALMGEDD